MVDLAKLVVRLEAETARYVTELNKAQKQLAQLSDVERAAQQAEEQRARAMEDGARVFAETRTPMERYATEVSNLNELLKQGAIDQETFARAVASAQMGVEKSNAAFAEGRNVFKQTRTPMEQYSSEIEKLNKLLGEGAIDQETFNRAVASAKTDLDRSNSSLEEGRSIFAATRTAQEQYAAETENLNKLLAQGAIDQDTFNRAVAASEDDLQKSTAAFAEGRSVFESTRTPMERYAAETENLNKLLAQSAIDQETFNRAISAAKSDLDSTNVSLAEGRAVFEATRTPMEKYTTEIDKLTRLSKQGAIDQETFARAVKQSKRELELSEKAARRSSEGYQLFAKAAKAFVLITAAVSAGLIATVKSSIDAADAMSKLAEKTGVSTKSLSELSYAAGLSNISADELGDTLKKLANTTVDAQKKGSAAAEAFKAIGVETKDASGNLKEQDELLLDIADAFARYEDGAAKSSVAQDIFSRGGDKLIPFLNQGREGIERLTAEARDFGKSLTDEVGKQASEFNDNLTRLQARVSGIGMAIAADLLPNLVALTGNLAESSKESELFQRISETAGTIIRGLADFTLGTATAFIKLGNAIGGTAAAAVAAAQGNFTQAGEIWKQMTADNVKIEEEYQKQRAAIWKQGGDDVLEEVKITVKKIREQIRIGNTGELNLEVKITAKKIETSPVAQLMDEFDQATKTSLDLAQDQYNKEKAMLDVLLEAKRISVDEYNERISESFDKFLPAFDVTVEKIKEKTKKATDELTEFQKEAMRNTQDILATGLETALEEGVSKGADSALDAFGDMIEKMILQAIAANVAQYLFGKPGEEGDTGGLLGGLFGSVFGGTKDSGGRGKKGMAYKIGTGAQPEMFVPDQDGTFYPRNQWAMGGAMQGVTQNIYVEGRADARTARQLEIEAARRQRSAASRLG